MRSALAALMLLAAVGCSSTEDAAPLAWLAGCWTDGTIVERWSVAGDGYLFGYSVTLDEDGKVAFFEQLRIEPGVAGPVYQAYPGGRGPTAFTTVEQGSGTITFANPAHDYPQKMSYTRNGDTLRATIALMDGSRPGHWDYHACAR
ncbi:MAG: hypothetical protein KJO54_01350 [Gammaproteobacteria bacterium]|nr:hypothetical protein [Gammaproteobacteria bacterium]NNF60127.1 hypothetical protein [Gammaproteobacteria bacterium]NNM21539.1 hypothetical protein [Gammaproteobacteria bacterium]